MTEEFTIDLGAPDAEEQYVSRSIQRLRDWYEVNQWRLDESDQAMLEAGMDAAKTVRDIKELRRMLQLMLGGASDGSG